MEWLNPPVYPARLSLFFLTLASTGVWGGIIWLGWIAFVGR